MSEFLFIFKAANFTARGASTPQRGILMMEMNGMKMYKIKF